jgi:hypothetical protein
MKSRKSVELNQRFNKRWLGYLTAAGAAGVALTAGTPAARADIIYTPVNLGFAGNGSLSVSEIGLTLTGFTSNSTIRQGTTDGGAWRLHQAGAGVKAFGPMFVGPAPLPFGAFIGSYQKGGFRFSSRMAFVHGSLGRTGSTWTWYPSAGGGFYWRIRNFNSLHPLSATRGSGFWGSSTGYLGFAFGPAGDVRYGWASLDISEVTGTGYVYYDVSLTGYAYNAVVGAPITAGQISSTPEPGTLGLLALGSVGLGFWRRRKAVTSDK